MTVYDILLFYTSTNQSIGVEMKIQELFSIDHMTHIKNLDSILKCGKLLAHRNPYKKVDISNMEVNNRRTKREPIYGRQVHDYVPFYFNPRNAMMYKNKDEDVIILAFDTKIMTKYDMLFTDRNASADRANFFNSLKDFDQLDWKTIESKSWYPDNDIKQKMMAEVLIYKEVSLKHLKGIYCKDQATKDFLITKYSFKKIPIKVCPSLFFKYDYSMLKRIA